MFAAVRQWQILRVDFQEKILHARFQGRGFRPTTEVDLLVGIFGQVEEHAVQPCTALSKWQPTKVSARLPMFSMDDQSLSNHLGSFRSRTGRVGERPQERLKHIQSYMFRHQAEV